MPWLQDDQLARRSGHEAAPARGHHDHVLDPDAPEPADVDTRLNGDHRSLGQDVRTSCPERRALVNLQADPVTERVRVVVPEPRSRNDVPGGPVDVPAGGP